MSFFNQRSTSNIEDVFYPVEYNFSYTPPKETFIVNLRGANGSGKTTIPFSILKSGGRTFQIKDSSGKVMATCSEKYRFAFIGRYNTLLKSSGCDTLKGIDTILKYTEQINSDKSLKNYSIVLEGIFMSCAYTSLHFINKLSGERIPLCVYLKSDINDNLKRLQKRNNGITKNYKQVQIKWKEIESLHLKVKERNFIRYRELENVFEETTVENLVNQFFGALHE